MCGVWGLRVDVCYVILPVERCLRQETSELVLRRIEREAVMHDWRF